MLYDVISLSNEPSGQNDYEVSDAHYTGHQVELPENATLPDVMKALKTEDMLHKHITRQSLYLMEETGEAYYVRATRDNSWLWELRPASNTR